ncbi:hypothetical protein GCM10022243_63280 [Saccharothrix violaceirubra]
MATLEVWYDQMPENDFGPGDPAIIVGTEAEPAALVDRVSAKSATQPCPSIVSMYVAGDPYGHPSLNAGIGAERAYVRIGSRTSIRTVGDADAVGETTYDFQGHGEPIPRRHEVPLAIVREVLAAYMHHDGTIPEDFADLHVTL